MAGRQKGASLVKRSFVLTPEATAGLREILLDIAENSVDAAGAPTKNLEDQVYEIEDHLRLAKSAE